MDTSIKEIVITEVGTRDGFQSEKKTVDTNDKILLINDLIQAGFKRIEFSSFVSPKAIPQLADADEVIKHVSQVPTMGEMMQQMIQGFIIQKFSPAIAPIQNMKDELITPNEITEGHGETWTEENNTKTQEIQSD